MEVVNTLNIIGNNYAISTADLAQSLTKSSASLVAAGGNLAEAAALTATANAIIQDADSVGTALKTTSLRLRGTSVKVLEEEGLDTDGAVESTSKLRSQVLAISGVDILTDTGAYKSTYQILLEIAEVWDQITDDKARAGLLELLAGKRNSSVIAALLQNPEDLKAAYKDAMNAEGSALKENEKYLDSIQGKIDQFNNAMQAMWSDTLDSDVVKFFVDLATQLVKIVDAIGPVNIAFVGFLTYLEKNHGIFSNFFKPAEDGVEALKQQLAKAEQDLAKTTQADVQHGNKRTAQERRDAQDRVDILRKQIDDAEPKAPVDPELGALIGDRDAFVKEVDAIKARREELAKAVESDSRDDMLKLVEIDTTSIDDDITDTQKKLEVAKQKLAKAESEPVTRKFNDGIRMNKERDQHITDASQEIANIEKDLDSLQKKKVDTVRYAAQFDLAEMDKTIGEASGKLDGMTAAINAKTAAEKADNIVTGESATIDAVAALASDGKVASTWKDVLATAMSKDATLADVGAKLKQLLIMKLLSTEYVKQQIANGALTKAQIANMTMTQLLGLGFKGLMAGIWGATKAMWTFMTTTPIGWILLAVGAVVALGAAFAAIHKSTEELQEELDGLKSELSDIRSELDSVNSELEKTNDRMEELLAKGNLTFEEQEELDKLRATNAELEHRKELLEDEEKHKAGIVGRQAAKVVDSKRDEIGTWLNGKSEDEEVLDDMADYREIKNKLDNASSLKDIEKYQKELDEKSAEIDEYIAVISEALNGVEYGDSAESDKALDYLAELRDQYSVARGTFNKTNYISRLFGDNASQELKDIKKDIEEAMKAGEEFDFSSAFDEDFKQNLYKMGVTVTDVKYYFQDLKKAEEEAQEFTTEDAIKAAAKLADKVESLKGAFEEFNETGIVTAQTLVELSETFGGMGDKWTDFVSIMTSGTASTEEAKAAINDLIETLITSALSGEKIETEQYVALWSQLTNMGVNNASELLNGIKEYSSIGEQIANEVLNGGKTIEEAISEYEKANNVLLTAEQKQVIAATYDAKSAKKKADTYNTQIQTLQTLTSEYERAKASEDELEKAVKKSEKKKSGKFLWISTRTEADKTNTATIASNEDNAEANRKAIQKQIEKLYDEVIAPTVEITDEQIAKYKETHFMARHMSDEEIKSEIARMVSTDEQLLALQTYFEDPQNYDELSEEAQGTLDELGDKLGLKVDLEFESFDTVADKVQSVYSTLKDITTEYNAQGYLSLDNLQALLQLQPEYLAVLKMEGGQLTINQSALQAMLETKLADAEATAVQTAITQLNALAERKKAIEVSNSAVAANQASIELGTYSGALSTVASDAIVAAGSVAAFNAALKGAQDNEFVSDEEWQQVLTNFQNTVGLIDSVRDNLPTSFNNILDPGSKTSGQEEAESEWDRLVAKYENRLALITNERNLIEAEIDKAEARGGKASAEYYEDLLRTSTEEKDLLEEQYTALSNYLEANKDAIDQDTWTDYNNTLNEVAVAIKECESNTIAWQEALREIDIHYFEQATDEISRLGKELELVDSLLEDEDVADENGNWSSAALTRMAMYTNLIEKAAADTQRYQSEIAKVEEQYKNGELSEEQYQERLATLTDGLYDSINAQNDARDSIIELNEARIDAIKEGIEKEIEAYEDLIDAKKEELDAERDLYDFRKNIKKQTKDISELERRIASLSGSSAASDVAERRRLEAQLMEAKEGLNDTYYDHSRDARSSALDDESEAYRKSQEKRIEKLEETLDNVELLIQNSMMDVLFNADIVYNELNDIADTYGITLSDELTQPWKDASAQAIAWKDELKLSMTSGEYAALIGEGGAITVFANGVGSKLSGSWNTAKVAVEKYSNFLTGTELGNKFSSTITGFANQIQKIIDKWNGVKTAADNAYQAQLRVQNVGGNPNAGSGSGSGGGGGNPTPTPSASVRTLQTILEQVYNKQVPVNGIWDTQTSNALKSVQKTIGVAQTGKYDYNTARALESNIKNRAIQSRKNGYSADADWYNKYYQMVPAHFHAKGTTGTTRDEWAITDEPQFGDELTMYATPEGTLSFMRAGSTVIPADLTRELIDLPKVVDGLINRPKFDSGINMIANAINKPEIVIDMENFLKVDRVDKDTLPQLEAMMDKKIDIFAKQLNYSIKRFSR